MFINYLVHEFVEFMVVHDLALIHELSEFMTVHEQPMFMNKVRVHEQNKFMNSWTFRKVSFVVQEYSWTFHENALNNLPWSSVGSVSEVFMTFLSDPRVTAALNKTMETKVQAITQPIFTKLKDHTRLIDELKN